MDETCRILGVMENTRMFGERNRAKNIAWPEALHFKYAMWTLFTNCSVFVCC